MFRRECIRESLYRGGIMETVWWRMEMETVFWRLYDGESMQRMDNRGCILKSVNWRVYLGECVMESVY